MGKCEEIKVNLDSFYGDSSPSMISMRYWFNEFKRSRTSVVNEKRTYLSADLVTEESSMT